MTNPHNFPWNPHGEPLYEKKDAEPPFLLTTIVTLALVIIAVFCAGIYVGRHL